jgi:prephenate dehydrogenase
LRATILGTGLIGASVGAGLREAGWKVTGWDPEPSHLREASEMGAVDEILTDFPERISGEDLVVLAGPVRAILASLGEIETDALVTDVASVKTSVVSASRRPARFVGGHPMAGRESSGPGAASAAMFRGATWILTTDGASPDDLATLEEVVTALGAVPVRMTAQAHDAAVAAVSHVPQVVASALVNLVAREDTALSLAAGGFRDLTRIALSEPAWWSDVLAANRDSVAGLVRRLTDELTEWAEKIERGDTEAIASGLEAARSTRRSLAPPVAAVQVVLEDRPGELAGVGMALAESGVDIRDLQLRHATRGGGGVLTLSVRPGQEEALTEALAERGFRLVG